MESLKNLTTLDFSPATLACLESPELLAVASCYGVTSVEEVERAKTLWGAVLAELEAVYTPLKLQQMALERKRQLYHQGALKLQDIELENRDQRIKGVSYKNRLALTDKIAGGIKYLKRLRWEGVKAKTTKYQLRNILIPSDLPAIKAGKIESIINLYL